MYYKVVHFTRAGVLTPIIEDVEILGKYKKSLGDKLLKELSEGEILKVHEQQDSMAEIIYSLWLDEITKETKEEV